MTDLEKVEEWERDFKAYVDELDIERDVYRGIMEYIDDALALLREHEKTKVVFRQYDGSVESECGNCGLYLDKTYSVCPKCGKELDWNA